MNCPMCGMTTDVTGLAHTCTVVLGPATFTPSYPNYQMRCKDCGGQFYSSKHQMTCVAPHLVDPRDAEIASLKLQVGELKSKLKDSEGDHRQIHGLQIQVGEYRKVVEGCRDVLAQFCGDSAPVIAHPQKCGFYKLGFYRDCTCTAKNTANDVLLSLKACRAILEGQTEKPKCEEVLGGPLLPSVVCGAPRPCPIHDTGKPVGEKPRERNRCYCCGGTEHCKMCGAEPCKCAEKRNSDEVEWRKLHGCICSEYDGKGRSTCGGICPVHGDV